MSLTQRNPEAPDPQVLTGSGALGVPPPLPPPLPIDTRPDGIDPVPVLPQKGLAALAPEFSDRTRVIFVNGINSDDAESRKEAQSYANVIDHPVELVHVETKGLLNDVRMAATETFEQRAAFEGRAEQAIAKEVLSLAASGKDVHIMAFSRGALVTERGLELAEQELVGRGFDAEHIKNDVFSHVTLETVNGASHNVPDGVRAVHYVREGDVLVGQSIGMGPVSPLVRASVAGEMARDGDVLGVAAEVRDGFLNRPGGPVIEVPPLPTANLVAQHLFPDMLPARRPFESVRAPYEREQQRNASVIREREAHPPTPRPMTPPAVRATPSIAEVQAGIDQLRATGPNLPDARSVVAWDGKSAVGSFVDLGNDTVAQHNGRGVYAVMDVHQHLGGVAPPFGETVRLASTGEISRPESFRSRAFELG